MNLAFDLDGTLVDTRDANTAAYRAAGIEPHPDHWRIRWETWCTKEQHDAKQEHFPVMLRKYGRLLPASEILFRVGGQILTNASQRSVNAVTWVFPKLLGRICHNNLSHDLKVEMLKHTPPGIYFDDLEDVCTRIRKETGWQAVNVSGL